jgi:hypothetical protein
LDPISGLVAAGLCGLGLLAVYCLRLRRRPVRVSSTMLWEQAVRDVQVNVPLRAPRGSLALLLQALALACVCLAIARPALEVDGAPGGRVVLLIDRSASMNALDGRGGEGETISRLDEARDRARELVARFRAASRPVEVLVAQFAAGAEALAPITSDRATLLEAIERVSSSDQPGDLRAALAFLDTLAQTPSDREDAPRAAPPTVYLLSDAGFAAEDEPLVVRGLDVRLVRVGGAATPPGAMAARSREGNAGVVALSARRDYDDPASVRVFARVVSSALVPAEVRVSLALDGREIDAQQAQIPAASRDAQGALLPGERSLAFRFTSSAAGLLTLSLGGGDLLAADDSASLWLAAPARPRVLLVGPANEGPDPFLLSVLRTMAGETGELAAVESIDAQAYATLPASGPNQPGKPDLVIFDRVRPGVLPAAPSLSFGAGLPVRELRVEPVGDDRAEGTRLASWRRAHPVLRGVPIESLVVAPAVRLRWQEDAPGAAVTSLAEGGAGPLIAQIDDAGRRRLVFAFELARSNLGPMVAFPVLLAQAIDHLTLRAEAQAGAAFSTTAPVALRPAPQASEIVVDTQPPRRVPRPEAGQSASLGVFERAGTFALRGAAGAQAFLPVNLLDANESGIDARDALPLAGANQTKAGAGERAGEELWPWLVLAALALLVAEWFVFAWSMRV